MTLGQHIAQKRRELGLSQEQLGQEMGVSRQAIYKWESDATVPEIDKLIALSDGQTVEVEAQGQQSFEGKIACPLSDRSASWWPLWTARAAAPNSWRPSLTSTGAPFPA